MSERVAIVGTAGTWNMVPWNDPSLKVWSLNDAYRMKGFVRADRWYDFHPPDKWWGAPDGANKIFAHQIPVGHYVRPSTHKQWLLAQSIPVYLHPEYQTTWPDACGKPHVQALPHDVLFEEFGRYFTSSPAFMLAHAVMEGCRELHIYGIHLATEHEYIEQRPNFEFLIGRVLGPSKITQTNKDGLRYYETKDGLVVLPEASPVLQSEFVYAFEQRPRAALEPLKWEAHKLSIKRERALNTLRTAPWWKSLKQPREELIVLDAKLADVNEQMQRMAMGV